MNAPVWLTDLIVALLLAVTAFFLWRMATARVLDRRPDYPRDAFYALTALAIAQTQAKWINTLPRSVWVGVFVLAAVYFTAHALRARRGITPTGGASRRRHGIDAGMALVAVYMFAAGVAPSTLSGSTAGMVVMAGMPGMIVTHSVGYPTLGLALATGLLGYTVIALDHLSARRPDPGVGNPTLDPMDRPGPLPTLTPRTATACELVLAVVMAYAIIAALV